MDSDTNERTNGFGGDSGQLWAAMSHEIRTPLMGVVGMLEILARTSLTDEQRRIIATAEESSVALMRIVDDVLDFAKLETSTVRLALAPTDLGTLLEGSAELLAPAAAAKGLELTVETDHSLPLVMCDGVRLRQVLLNLGNNAIKFTERGHVSFTGRLWEQDAARATVRFTVADTGIGIPADLHGFLFKPFSQLATTSARGFGGVGLGLSICRSLIGAMGGAIEVESSERGSSFHVTVSFARALQTPAALEQPAQGVHVIAVDGGEAALGIAARYLKAAGADVTTVHSMNAIAGQLLPRTEAPTVVLVGPDAEADDIEAATSALARMSDDNAIPLLWLHPRAVGGAALSRRGVRALQAYPMRRADLLAAIIGTRWQHADAGPTLTRSARAVPALGVDEALANARAEGRIVLVAEDNTINQEVIRQQLAILGYDCDIAASGSLAVRALLEKSYLLLLCDCHMPGMDGFELTRIIRSGERSGRARLPIVAITANALPGEAARCKAAGMDDYLAKPIEIRTLEAALARWIPPPHRAQTSPSAAAAVVAMEEAGDNVSLQATVDLRKIAAMYGNDHARLAPVLEQWSITIGDAVTALSRAIDDAHWGDAMEIVHRIKGSAGIAGAHALSAAGSELEDTLLEKDHPRVHAAALRVRALAEAALGEVAAWRQAAVVDGVGVGAIT